MAGQEFVIVGGFALGFAVLRFGVPVALTWGIGRLLRTINGQSA